MAGKKIVIIGAGASGVIASIAAARHGAKVLLVERMRRVGKKLLATGNGRCNFTNTELSLDKYHGSNPEFAAAAFRQCGFEDTVAFFEKLGVSPVVEDDGRVFPRSNQASSVLDVLRQEMDRLGVNVLCDLTVQKVLPVESVVVDPSEITSSFASPFKTK